MTISNAFKRITFLRLSRKAMTAVKFGFVLAGMIAAPMVLAGSARVIATTTTTAVMATPAASTTAGHACSVGPSCVQIIHDFIII